MPPGGGPALPRPWGAQRPVGCCPTPPGRSTASPPKPLQGGQHTAGAGSGVPLRQSSRGRSLPTPGESCPPDDCCSWFHRKSQVVSLVQHIQLVLGGCGVRPAQPHPLGGGNTGEGGRGTVSKARPASPCPRSGRTCPWRCWLPPSPLEHRRPTCSLHCLAFHCITVIAVLFTFHKYYQNCPSDGGRELVVGEGRVRLASMEASTGSTSWARSKSVRS